MNYHRFIRLIQGIALGSAFLLLDVVPKSPGPSDGAGMTIGVNAASAGLFDKIKKTVGGDKKHKKQCKKWCGEHKPECRTCSRSGCAKGRRKLKAFKGHGFDWYACGETGSGRHEKACLAWCEEHEECSKCAKRVPGCLWDHKVLKRFKGHGVDWVACKSKPVEDDVCCDSRGTLACSAPNALLKGWNKRFHDACVRHDHCYRYGKVTYGKRKMDCDREFRSDMRAKCKRKKNKVERQACYAAARTYYEGVCAGGSAAYKKTAKKRCWYPDRVTTKSERKKIGKCRQEKTD